MLGQSKIDLLNYFSGIYIEWAFVYNVLYWVACVLRLISISAHIMIQSEIKSITKVKTDYVIHVFGLKDNQLMRANVKKYYLC